MSMKRGLLKASGGELSYLVGGKGPPVLFLHAFPLESLMWEEQAKALEAHHRLILLDDRGFGHSPPGDGLLTMERIADDAVALLDHLGVSKAALVGLSMGGYAAFAMVRRHLDRISALVLADTRAEPDSPEGRKSRSELSERVRFQGSSAAADQFLPKLLGETSHKERAPLVSRVREMILRASPQGIRDALAGLASRADSNPTLRQIRVPTLLVCGAEDLITPPADSERMRQGIHESTLAIVPRAGHLSNMENPSAFNEALGEFLRKKA